jgi:hypothetical protein
MEATKRKVTISVSHTQTTDGIYEIQLPFFCTDGLHYYKVFNEQQSICIRDGRQYKTVHSMIEIVTAKSALSGKLREDSAWEETTEEKFNEVFSGVMEWLHKVFTISKEL